jgi:glycine oxidase
MSGNVVVVGAGIIGCAVARELSARGVSCTVFDPRPVAGGATQASAGILAPYVEAHERGPLLELGLESLGLFETLIRHLRGEGFEVPFGLIGTLEVALTSEQAARLKRGRMGGWLEPSDVARTYPQLRPTLGGFSNEEHGFVDARLFAAALAGSARRHGVRFQQARVERVDRVGERLIVHADGERIEASTVVMAAGAWSNQIAGTPTLSLRPVRGQLLLMRWDFWPLQSIVWGPDCYIVPRIEDGTIIVGATVEDAGFDERITEAGVTGLLAAARRLIPQLRDDALLEVRVGLRPATPDELPIVGPDPNVPGLIHASGHYRNGILLAPITGKVVADLITDGRTDVGLEAFRPDRF